MSVLGRFMKNFHFDTFCIIIQEPQELQRYNCACRFIGKSVVINIINCWQTLLVLTENHVRPVRNNFLLYPSLNTYDIQSTRLLTLPVCRTVDVIQALTP